MTRPEDHTPPSIIWGRCPGGGRWFWTARIVGGEDRHGWASNRNDAARKANRAAVLLAVGQYASIRINDDDAELKLAAVIAEKHAQAKAEDKKRTAAGETPVNLYAVERGYYDHGACHWVHSRIVRLPVTKTTPRRIYFLRSSEPGEYERGYIDRQDFEARGWVYSSRYNKIYAKPPELPNDKPFIPPPFRSEYPYAPVSELELKRLKIAMRDAHPDKGGSSEAFIKARAEYEHARDRVSR
ncbi:hypothetical protein [Streptacidiphilus carbonis]|uniref:hypothetical protein n=1 Tax=Streptacidiphilus carbonis TaxID=105422 RepID=UPI0005A66414|nr:hypothetical protein [Streptacidiphilus carbonis]